MPLMITSNKHKMLGSKISERYTGPAHCVLSVLRTVTHRQVRYTMFMDRGTRYCKDARFPCNWYTDLT